MSVKKIIQDELEKIRQTEIGYFNHQTQRVLQGIDDFNAKLDSKQSSAKSRLIAIRNWLNHFLLWCILVALVVSLLSSCFVAARTAYLETPFAKAAADTVTAVVGRAYKPLIDKQ